VTINGRIDPAGDRDWFSFDASKGQHLEFRVLSSSLGFPLDPVMRIEDSNGKSAVRDEDGGQRGGPLLVWSAPSNGTYRLVLSDLFHQGGPEFVYRLEVGPPVSDFKVTADASMYRLEAGKTNDVKLTITRSGGYTNKLVVSVRNLPEGVTAKTAEMFSSKEKEAKISLIAGGDAKPFSGPIQIHISGSSKDNLVRHAFVDLGPKESRAGEMLISQTDQLWLTVATNSVVEKATAK